MYTLVHEHFERGFNEKTASAVKSPNRLSTRIEPENAYDDNRNKNPAKRSMQLRAVQYEIKVPALYCGYCHCTFSLTFRRWTQLISPPIPSLKSLCLGMASNSVQSPVLIDLAMTLTQVSNYSRHFHSHLGEVTYKINFPQNKWRSSLR